MNKCLGGADKPLLQGFSDDLDGLFAKYLGQATGEQKNLNDQAATAAEKSAKTSTVDTVLQSGSPLSTIGTRNTEKVKEQTRQVFEGELAQTLQASLNRVLSEYVVAPYQQVCEDYT